MVAGGRDACSRLASSSAGSYARLEDLSPAPASRGTRPRSPCLACAEEMMRHERCWRSREAGSWTDRQLFRASGAFRVLRESNAFVEFADGDLDTDFGHAEEIVIGQRGGSP